MKRYLPYLLHDAERRTSHFLTMQVTDPNSVYFGGMEDLIIQAKREAYVLATAAAVYINRDSIYYKNEELMTAMLRAIDFIQRAQRPNGTFDLPTCNFMSAPDTAFCFKRLFAAYRLMKKYEKDTDTKALQEKYLQVMRQAAAGIRDGGFHTPNHRWAITAALLQAAHLFEEDKEFAAGLKAQAQKYLNEGVDGDEDGSYAERSTGNYNAVVNNAMIAIYEETGDPAYLGYAERNLHMMEMYFDPDGTIFTKNSTRYDNALKPSADKYFYQYLYMLTQADLSEDRRAEFDAAAHKMIRDNISGRKEAPDCFHIIMLYDEMLNYTFSGDGYPETFRRFFADAGVYRVKNEKFTYTVLKDSKFLYLNVRGYEVYFKIAESVCETRDFIPKEIIPTDNGCIMKAEIRSWYYLPWKEKPASSDWWQMDNKNRDRLVNAQLYTSVTVEEKEDGLELTVETEGLDAVPLSLELHVPPKVFLENDFLWMEGKGGESVIMKAGTTSIRHGERLLTYGPGFCEHQAIQYYGEDEIREDTDVTLVNSMYTPCKKSVQIRVLR